MGLLSEMTGSWRGGRGGTADPCEISPGKHVPKASWVVYEVHQGGRCEEVLGLGFK